MNQQNYNSLSLNHQVGFMSLQNECYQTELLDPPKNYIAVFSPAIIMLSDNWDIVYSLIYMYSSQGCHLPWKICTFITEEEGRIFLSHQLINFIGNLNNWKNFSIPMLNSLQLNLGLELDDIVKAPLPAIEEIRNAIEFRPGLF